MYTWCEVSKQINGLCKIEQSDVATQVKQTDFQVLLFNYLPPRRRPGTGDIATPPSSSSS